MGESLQLSNNFALEKCPEDLISQLPDDILVHILSFLSINEAADTSVLSKRWLGLWRYIPRLDFNATKPLFLKKKLRKIHMKKYVRWVNHTLQMSKVQRLDKFRVSFDLNKFSQHEIDKWLEFAFARQVERLELDLLEGWGSIQDFKCAYTFPAQLLGLNYHAGQPHLNNLHEFPPLWHNFKSVKVLILKSVNVTGEVLMFFLHNCLFLEEMVVHGAGELVNLEVAGSSLKLKHLGIWYCPDLKSLKIRDTNLVTFGTSEGRKLSLSNAPMLIEADIIGFTETLDDILAPVSCVLPQLEVLKVSTSLGLVYKGHYKLPEFTKLKKFVVCASVRDDMSLLGCTHVTGAAPLLNEFELQLKWTGFSRLKRECRKLDRCPLQHLKVLRLCGSYYGRTNERELIAHLLENAVALEKIIIDTHCQYDTRIQLVFPETKKQQMGRNFVKHHLGGVVPPHIELVIL